MKIELSGCQQHEMTVGSHLALFFINDKLLTLKAFSIFSYHQPPSHENGFYPGNEIPGTERFFHIVVRSILDFSSLICHGYFLAPIS
jgi:hypothetical protein